MSNTSFGVIVPSRGLVAVPDADLRTLVAWMERGTLPSPLSRAELLGRGLNRVAENGDLLLGLDTKAVRSVVLAVLMERKARGG
jgi:hypothetical protein